MNHGGRLSAADAAGATLDQDARDGQLSRIAYMVRDCFCWKSFESDVDLYLQCKINKVSESIRIKYVEKHKQINKQTNAKKICSWSVL